MVLVTTEINVNYDYVSDDEQALFAEPNVTLHFIPVDVQYFILMVEGEIPILSKEYLIADYCVKI